MSSDLTITFAPDMPAATVEVVAPDFQVVGRVMLAGGRSKVVQVPSEATFLRVLMPFGETVTLQDPGNLSRTISKETLSSKLTSRRPGYAEQLESDESSQDRSSLFDLNRYHALRARSLPDIPAGSENTLPLSTFGHARLLSGQTPLPGTSVSRSREAHWRIAGGPLQPPLVLRIERPQEAACEIRIPADADHVWARADRLRDHDGIAFSVRLSTTEPAADTILGYLQRGDLYSAEAMTEWIAESEELLLYKKADPYAAAVGAYLLLRLKRFANLRDWPKNLADRFEFLPDGCVIWAWQLIQQRSADTAQIRNYLIKATERGLPVYAEGLRLLIEGLRLLGKDTATALAGLTDRAGVVVWDSPLTTTIHVAANHAPTADRQPIVYDVAFSARS